MARLILVQVMRVWVLWCSRLPAGSKGRTSCCLVWGWVPVMALWHLHPSLAARSGLGQDAIVMWREGGFTLGRARLTIQAFLFCVSIHLKLWGQQMSGCCLQAWAKSLTEDSHQNKLHGWSSSLFFQNIINKYFWYSKADIGADEKSHSRVSKLTYF